MYVCMHTHIYIYTYILCILCVLCKLCILCILCILCLLCILCILCILCLLCILCTFYILCIYVYYVYYVCGVNRCFRGIYDLLSFSILRRGVQAAHSVLKTLDECWWYLTWSVRRTCHDTISIFEFCDSLTAATVLNLSFLNMFGCNGLSRANSLIDMSLVNRHSVLQACYWQRCRHGPVVILVEPGNWVTTL